MSAARGARPVTTGAKCAIATPDTAAVRSGGDRPAVEDRDRQPGPGSLSTTTALIAGRPSALFAAEPGDPFHPEQVVRTGRVAAAQVGGHGVRERTGRPRVDADLRRQFRVGDERDEGLLREREPLVEVRHRGRARPRAAR